MMKIATLIAVAAFLAPAAIARAADPPPGWISSPPAGSINASMPGTTSLQLPPLTLPKRQLLTQGGCVIDGSWTHSAGELFVRVRPFGRCAVNHIEKTLAWQFDTPKPAAGFTASTQGVGFNVVIAAKVRRVQLSFTTVYGSRQTCSPKVVAFSGRFTCR